MSFGHGPTFGSFIHDREGEASEVCWEIGRRSGLGKRPPDIGETEPELAETL